jgi:hypothetical protein
MTSAAGSRVRRFAARVVYVGTDRPHTAQNILTGVRISRAVSSRAGHSLVVKVVLPLLTFFSRVIVLPQPQPCR